MPPTSRLLIALVATVVTGLTLVAPGAAPAAASGGEAASPATAPATPTDPVPEPPPEREEAVPGPVVFVGVPGLRWDDVSPSLTHLWSMVEHGAVGALSVRSVHTVACPVDGWLAVSAGRRAADARTAQGCTPMWQPTGGQVGAWDRYVRRAELNGFGALPGLLGEQLSVADAEVAAVGPGAAIATANAEGVLVGEYHRGSPPESLRAEVATTLADEPELLVVDPGAVRDPRTPADPADLTGTEQIPVGETRQSQVARVDSLLGTILSEAGAEATVIVASIADTETSPPHLGLLAVHGPASDGSTFDGILGSTSTRQEGLAQTTDMAPTLLDLLGIPAPTSLVGSPLEVVAQGPDSAEETYAEVSDLDAAAQAVVPLIPTFFRWLVYSQIVFYGVAALALRSSWGGPTRRRTVLTWLRRVSVLLACVPVSTFLANLVPWWRADNDAWAVSGLVAGFSLVIAAGAMLGPWRRRPLGTLGAVAGITAGVLAADVLTGSRLQLSSIMGLQPLVGGRFYGLGNQQFALFATGAILLATALAAEAKRRARHRLAVGVIIVVGLLTVVIDGTPGLGSDFGGPPALIPAFAVLTLLTAGVRLSFARVGLVVAGTLAAVAALSLVDYLRPAADRTHLGRFVETVLSGGAGAVIERKLSQNLAILVGSEISLLVPLGMLFVIAVLMRPAPCGPAPLQQAWRHDPVLKYGLIAVVIALLIGMAVNDSGTVVPGIGSCLAIPLLIAVCAHTRMVTDAQDPLLSNSAGDGAARD